MSKPGIRSIRLDVTDRTVERLVSLKEIMDAATYSEVFRAALRALEREIGRERANNGHV